MARKNKKSFATSDVIVTFVKTEFDSDENPLFSKVKINFLYKGMNRNGSYISKRTAEKMGSRIAYIPIVGEFIQAKEDFGTHGGKLTITSDDIVYEETTVPYGVVGAGAENLWWEEVEDENGKKVEYLTTWGYLWTKRYPDAERVLMDNNWQSMELDPDTLEGRWIQKKGQDDFYFNIDEAWISAFCILGEDVAPAFEDSQVRDFSLKEITQQEKFKLDYAEMQSDFAKFMAIESNSLGEEEQIDKDNLNKELEGGTESMLYKLDIENPSVVFSSLNEEDVATKIVIEENEDSVVYFDLNELKFYTRKFSFDEEENLVWAEEDAEAIEYTLPVDTTELEGKVETLEEAATNFDLEIEQKEKTIGELNATIQELNGSVERYEALEAQDLLNAKKEAINEFKELVAEEEIEKIEAEIENFTIEDIKSKLALIVYENSKETDDVDTGIHFTKTKETKPTGSNLPNWAKAVVDKRNK